METKSLRRAVAAKVLVDDVSIRIAQGEVLAVVGPSGAGKSSFLRLLNRLDEPTAGTVLVDDQEYRSIATRELRRRVGMVMQMAYLFPGTVAANIAFGPLQRREVLAADQIEELARLRRSSGISVSGYQQTFRRRGPACLGRAHLGERPGSFVGG
jgi:putative ABC transport system ATP-binding protein